MRIRAIDPAGAVRTGTFDGDIVTLGHGQYEPAELTWLPPSQPTKVICLARNTVDHADEHDATVPDRPEYFLKPPSAMAAHGGTVAIPPAIAGVEHEAELAAVIGATATDVPRADALDVVAGLTCFNDVSNRSDQRAELNWVRGKAFDGAAPIGPGLVPPDAVPPDATITLHVNGERRQHGSRDDYVFDLETVIADLTRYLTLEPGDVIALGTPSGVGPLEDGDHVSIDIEGIGTLEHDVTFLG